MGRKGGKKVRKEGRKKGRMEEREHERERKGKKIYYCSSLAEYPKYTYSQSIILHLILILI